MLSNGNANVVVRRFRHFRPIRVKALLPVKRISSNIYQEQIQIKMLLDWQTTKFKPIFDGVISMCRKNLILIWFDFTAFSGVERNIE